MHIKFLTFKSKAFISLLCLNSLNRSWQRKLSKEQTYISDRIKYVIDKNYIHSECKDINGLTVPAVETIFGGEWWKNGMRHRDDKDSNNQILPAVVMSYIEEWWKNGMRHRDDKNKHGLTLPAVITKNCKEWWVNNKLHRDDKAEYDSLCNYSSIFSVNYKKTFILPAYIYHRPYIGTECKWYVNGKLHRNDKDANGFSLPAYMNNFTGENLKQWYVNGVLHRDEKFHLSICSNSLLLPGTYYQNKDFIIFPRNEAYGYYDDNKTLVPYTLPAEISNSHIAWYKNGKRHRDDKDKYGQFLYAVLCSDHKEWWIDGVRCNKNKILFPIVEKIYQNNTNLNVQNIAYIYYGILFLYIENYVYIIDENGYYDKNNIYVANEHPNFLKTDRKKYLYLQRYTKEYKELKSYYSDKKCIIYKFHTKLDVVENF